MLRIQWFRRFQLMIWKHFSSIRGLKYPMRTRLSRRSISGYWMMHMARNRYRRLYLRSIGIMLVCRAWCSLFSCLKLDRTKHSKKCLKKKSFLDLDSTRIFNRNWASQDFVTNSYNKTEATLKRKAVIHLPSKLSSTTTSTFFLISFRTRWIRSRSFQSSTSLPIHLIS